jgi:hypothetical protein
VGIRECTPGAHPSQVISWKAKANRVAHGAGRGSYSGGDRSLTTWRVQTIQTAKRRCVFRRSRSAYRDFSPIVEPGVVEALRWLWGFIAPKLDRTSTGIRTSQQPNTSLGCFRRPDPEKNSPEERVWYTHQHLQPQRPIFKFRHELEPGAIVGVIGDFSPTVHSVNLRRRSQQRHLPWTRMLALGRRWATSTARAPSLSCSSLRRQSSEIRTGCANERPSGSGEGVASNHDPYSDPTTPPANPAAPRIVGVRACLRQICVVDLPVGFGPRKVQGYLIGNERRRRATRFTGSVIHITIGLWRLP